MCERQKVTSRSINVRAHPSREALARGQGERTLKPCGSEAIHHRPLRLARVSRDLTLLALLIVAAPLARAAESGDPIVRLQQRIDSGEVELVYRPHTGYLASLLEAFDIPLSSQTLVFSKTSAQFRLIKPRSPRALYFNDDVYVGYVPGGPILEISAATADGAAVFYSLLQSPRAAPQFTPDIGQCLQCHDSARSDGVAGHMLRSVYPEPSGQPLFRAGTTDVRPSTPFSERYGGWYVSGKSGSMTHRGNLVVEDPDNLEAFEAGSASNVEDLSRYFDTRVYLTPHSDLVALMVLTHQVRVHNAIARAGEEARRAIEYRDDMTSRFGEASEEMLASVGRRIGGPAEKLVSELLSLDEAPLEGPVSGTSSFAEEFQALGPRDSQGRSLRDLDLETRLLRYKLSWLVYSEAFDGLPDETLDYVYRRLDELLEPTAREILLETKPAARARLSR